MILVRGRSLPAHRILASHLHAGEIDEETASRELIARLNEAVRIRLISEVPLARFCPGGVDSSGVVASMARQTDFSGRDLRHRFRRRRQRRAGSCGTRVRLYRTHHMSSRWPQIPSPPIGASRDFR
jgi:asparagine synthetase B (glutamine-hydrolysing)